MTTWKNVERPLVNFCLKQYLPKIFQANNLNVCFLLFYLVCSPIEDVGGVVKWVSSLLTFPEGLGTILETTNTLFTWSWAIFLKILFIIEKIGEHKGADWTKLIALHPWFDCMDPLSMEWPVEVKLTVKSKKTQSSLYSIR